MKIRLDPLDRLFSEFVRRRAIQRVNGCERCLQGKTSYKQLQTAHFISRRHKSVRWNEDNAVGICFGCHQYLDSHAVEKVEFFRNLLGERDFDLLRARTRTPARFIDREAIGIYLKMKVKELLND